MSAAKTKGVAIVTGCAQGIGKAIALRLVDDGLDVAISDLPTKQDQLEAIASVIRRKGRRAIVVSGDVTVEKDVAAIVNKTVEELGQLDVVSHKVPTEHWVQLAHVPLDDCECRTLLAEAPP